MAIEPFVQRVSLLRERVPSMDAYPFNLPAIRALEQGIKLSPVTYFVGENGSGKSTLLEGIAVALGFNAEGGTTNFSFSTRSSESPLHRCLRISRSAYRPRNHFFLRAESFFNLATNIEELDAVPAPAPPLINSYGGKSLHEQSHGESFRALVDHRFGPRGLYLMDEPEAALSPAAQVALLGSFAHLIENDSQLLVATHAPIVLAHPGATIYQLDATGIRKVAYEETETVQITRRFLDEKRRA